MRWYARALPIVLLLTLAAGLGAPPASAAAPASYFPETSHSVAGTFLSYWQTWGGVDIFGYPITEPFVADGRTVQYFERARFEEHPEFAGTPDEVQLSRLGWQLTRERQGNQAYQPVAAFADTATQRYFPESGHGLSNGFKYYWDTRGGLPIFGLPISEEHDEVNPADGRTYTVQYFERARFEYHPEHAGTPYEVQLGLLGWQQANQGVVPDDARAPAAPAGGSSGPAPGGHLGYGLNVHLFYTDRDRVLSAVRDLGFSWVRQQVQWMDLEGARGQRDWSELDAIVAATNQYGVKLMLSVVKAPSWATSDGGHGMPADPADLQSFLQDLAARYRGRVAAYEIWNEENTGGETNHNVDAGRYVELLKAGYTGVKAGDSGAVVIYGGLTPTGVMDPAVAIDDVTFLQQTYQYQGGVVRNYFDVLGAHPGSNNNSPEQMWPDNPGPGPGWRDHPSFYFRRVEQLRQVMEEYGDAGKQMWLTEFGWTTQNAAPGYGYGDQITEELQAQYLVQAFQKADRDYPWMGVMAVWNLNFATLVPPTDEKYPWSIVNGDWSPRPAYTALKDMPK